MASYTINQYQYFEFNYADLTAGLYINNQPDNIGFYQLGLSYVFEVDVMTEAGVYVYDIYDSLNMPYDTITLTVNAVTPSIVHTGCIGDINQFTSVLPPAPIGNWILSGNYYPEFLFLVPPSGYLVPIIDRIGNYYVLFEDDADPLNNVYLVKFELQSCFEEYDLCTPYKINVVWLNPSGGWSSYCFRGRKTYGVNIDEKLTFKDSNKIRKYYNNRNVYNTIEVLSGEVPLTHITYLKSLKYSIQAYIKIASQFIPILIDDKTFTLYQDGESLLNYNIVISYATEIDIQTQ